MVLTENNYLTVKFCLRCGQKMILEKDKEAKLRPRCSRCGWTYYKNPVPAAACVIINEQKEIVIIKRKFAPAAGEWALPSGYIEIDQNPEETAVEEMKEETGLEGIVTDFLGYYSDYSPLYEKVISLGFLMKVTGGKLLAGDDAAEACYVPLVKVPDLAFESHIFFIEKVKNRF